MSRETASRVFEPLFSTKAFGVGLGMPLVKRIVEQHGGSVLIDSEQGAGTRVSIVLPRAGAGSS
ncbi:Globin-coupled histidine kinase [compost metagenome]